MNLLRQLERYNILPDERTQYVVLRGGRIVSSVEYALAVAHRALTFVREYRASDETIRREFGMHVSLEDLEAEMLLALVKAAQDYGKGDETKGEFKPYLGTCLKNRVWRLHSEAWRHQPQNGYVKAIDDILEEERPRNGYVEAIDDISEEDHPYMDDLFEQSDSLEVAIQFLSTLTPLQSLIVRYKIEHPGEQVKQVAIALRSHLGSTDEVARVTLYREMNKIRAAYKTYANTTERSWLRFLRRIEKREYVGVI